MKTLLYAFQLTITVILLVWLVLSVLSDLSYEFTAFALALIIFIETMGISLLRKRN